MSMHTPGTTEKYIYVLISCVTYAPKLRPTMTFQPLPYAFSKTWRIDCAIVVYTLPGKFVRLNASRPRERELGHLSVMSSAKMVVRVPILARGRLHPGSASSLDGRAQGPPI